MAAIAHQLIEPLDPAEAEMSEADFEIIQRAHAVCEHPPARELPVEIGLDQRAQQALSEARAVLQDLDAETETRPTVSPPETSEMDDEYNGSTFAAACRKADAKARAQLISPDIKRRRELLEDDTSLERAYSEINRSRSRAANSTVDALVFDLRRGVSALQEPDIRRRLAELSDEQVVEVGGRLRRLKPEIAGAWTTDQTAALLQLREQLR
jgi:hypothetical protein